MTGTARKATPKTAAKAAAAPAPTARKGAAKPATPTLPPFAFQAAPAPAPAPRKGASKKAAPAEAAPAQPSKRLDLAALASGSQTVAALPKATRNGAPRTTGGAFGELVKASYDNGTVQQLPPVPTEAAVTTLRNALRRAATAHGLGISIRPTLTDGGWVVSFKAKARRA